MQCFQLCVEGRNVLKKFQGLFNRHLKNVRNVLAFILDEQRFLVETLAVALFAFHINIGQKIHLYFFDSLSLAYLAPSPLYVETETPRLISSYFRLFHIRKKASYVRKGVCVGCRI